MFCVRDEVEVIEFCENVKCPWFTPCYENNIMNVKEVVDEEIKQMSEHTEYGFQKVFEEEEYDMNHEDDSGDMFTCDEYEEADKINKSNKTKISEKKKEVNLEDVDLFL